MMMMGMVDSHPVSFCSLNFMSSLCSASSMFVFFLSSTRLFYFLFTIHRLSALCPEYAELAAWQPGCSRKSFIGAESGAFFGHLLSASLFVFLLFSFFLFYCWQAIKFLPSIRRACCLTRKMITRKHYWNRNRAEHFHVFSLLGLFSLCSFLSSRFLVPVGCSRLSAFCTSHPQSVAWQGRWSRKSFIGAESRTLLSVWRESRRGTSRSKSRRRTRPIRFFFSFSLSFGHFVVYSGACSLFFVPVLIPLIRPFLSLRSWAIRHSSFHCLFFCFTCFFFGGWWHRCTSFTTKKAIFCTHFTYFLLTLLVLFFWFINLVVFLFCFGYCGSWAVLFVRFCPRSSCVHRSEFDSCLFVCFVFLLFLLPAFVFLPAVTGLIQAFSWSSFCLFLFYSSSPLFSIQTMVLFVLHTLLAVTGLSSILVLCVLFYFLFVLCCFPSRNDDILTEHRRSLDQLDTYPAFCSCFFSFLFLGFLGFCVN